MNPNPIPGGPAPAGNGASRASATRTGAPSLPGAAPAGDGGPAFRALLEQLEARTRDLKAASADVADTKSLAGAVDAARVSIEDALSLHDRLLEAYRASQHRTSGPTPTED